MRCLSHVGMMHKKMHVFNFKISIKWKSALYSMKAASVFSANSAVFLAQEIMANCSNDKTSAARTFMQEPARILMWTCTEKSLGERHLRQQLRGHVESLVLLKGHYLSPDCSSDSRWSLREERFILALIYAARGTVWMKVIKAIILA